MEEEECLLLLLVVVVVFAIYGHHSQWSVTIWLNSQSRFNSRIDVKFGEM